MKAAKLNEHCPKTTIRIFVSSPGDVGAERLAAERVLKRLRDQYASDVIVEPFFWEYEPLTATHHFQEKIPPPSSMDICVCILWSRMGTPLPAAEFKRQDGTSYSSGTEYEFEDAFSSYQQHGRPDLLVYRKTAKPQFFGTGAGEAEEFASQLRHLEQFIECWFHRDRLPAKAYTTFDATREFSDKLAVHVGALIERRMHDVGRREAVWKNGSPFRGLQAFDVEHAPIFSGRSADTHRVIEQLKHQAVVGRAFVLVTGNSGSGKSSLIRAGVLPTLMTPSTWPQVDHWLYTILRPAGATGGNLIETLVDGLTSETALPQLAKFAGLAELIRGNPAGISVVVQGALAQLADERHLEVTGGKANIRLVVVVDQLEECYSNEQVSDAERSNLFWALSTLAQSGSVMVLATLRSDFYERFCAEAELSDLKEGDGLYDLQPPTKAEIGQMIRRPAFAAGLQFEEIRATGESLDEVLREDAAKNPGSLPLLEFCLEQLYGKARIADSDLLTFKAYEQIGRIEGAIRLQAERAFDKVSQAAQKALPRVYRQLVYVAEEGAPSRRRALAEDVATDGPSRELVEAFIDARLLIAAGGMLEPAHEALLTHWRPLVDWLKEDRELLRIRQRVSVSATRWHAEDKRRDLLLPAGKHLEEAARLISADFVLPESDRDFINTSLARVQANARLRLATILSLAVLSVIASVAGVVAMGLARKNTSLLQATRTELYVAQMNLAADALRSGKTALLEELLQNQIPETNQIDLRGFEWYRMWKAIHSDLATLTAHEKNITDLAVSPDGRMIASCEEKGTVILWELALGTVLHRIETDSNPLMAIGFSSNSDELFVSADGELQVWDVATAQRKREMPFPHAINIQYSAIVGELALSANGRLIALRVLDGNQMVLDLETGETVVELGAVRGGLLSPLAFSSSNRLYFVDSSFEIKVWDSATGEIETAAKSSVPSMSFALSPVDSLLAVAHADGNVLLWNIETGEKEVTLDRYSNHIVVSICFSADGRWLFGGLAEQAMIVWDASTGKQVGRTFGHEGGFRNVASTPNGKMVVSASNDTTLKIWSVEALVARNQFKVHDGEVLSVSFSPQDNFIATGGEDGRVAIWDASTGEEYAAWEDHAASVTSVCYSPSGDLLASAGSDRRIILRDTKNKTLQRELVDHRGRINGLAISPDGRLLASASQDLTIKLWDIGNVTNSAGPIATWLSTDGSFNACAFSPDGTTLAAANADGSVKVYDTATRKFLRSFREDESELIQLAFSPDGRQLATGSFDSEVQIWGFHEGKLIHTCRGHEMGIRGLAFHPDGKTLVSAQWSGEIRLWHVHTGHALQSLNPGGSIRSIAISHDGTSLAAGIRFGDRSGANNGFVMQWKAATEEEVFASDRKE